MKDTQYREKGWTEEWMVDGSEEGWEEGWTERGREKGWKEDTMDIQIHEDGQRNRLQNNKTNKQSISKK